MNPEDFLIELIKIPSESGNEKEIGDFIVKRLKNNFKIIKQQVNNNFNILATKGNPKILISSHLDTVQGNLEVKKDKEYVYGRGACDTKSQIAASIFAAETALSQGLNNFGLLFTVQEEGSFAGAKKACEILPESVKLISFGEPTNLKIVKGHNGVVHFKIICRGKAAH